jgi:hypothetical protein
MNVDVIFIASALNPVLMIRITTPHRLCTPESLGWVEFMGRLVPEFDFLFESIR